MRVTKKTDYALRILSTLVEHYHEAPIPTRELARRNDVPRRYLEQIMIALKAGGWVESTMGLRGGYVLSKHPAKITLGEVVRHFDGILAPIGCVSVSCYERCPQEAVCRYRPIFRDVRDYIAKVMDQTTLESVFGGLPLFQRDPAAALAGAKILECHNNTNIGVYNEKDK